MLDKLTQNTKKMLGNVAHNKELAHCYNQPLKNAR